MLRTRFGAPAARGGPATGAELAGGWSVTLGLDVPADAEPTRPWFHRDDIRANHYRVRDSTDLHLGETRPVAATRLALTVAGTPVTVEVPVYRLESAAPYGTLRRPFEVAPAVTVSVAPQVVLPRASDGEWEAAVTVGSDAPDPLEATVRLQLPQGWTAEPRLAGVAFGGPGEVRTVTFAVRPAGSSGGPGGGGAIGGRGRAGTQTAVAVVDVGGHTVREGYLRIQHRDLQTRRLYREATVLLPSVEARVPGDLRVGYVMGVGDAVPDAIAQLGATVSLLDAAALEGGPLSEFDALVVGTRAYAVRPDLVAANDRLLEYAGSGGHLIVLYQTPEYDPRTQAPFPASLPGNAEETSEEDAPVTLLAPGHPLLSRPFVIGAPDFEGWVEQRGSKFFATWADAYTPLVETHDTGQAPQEGVWLTATVGEGRYTYVALALHRQLPYGVPGAYRILANLLAAEH
jgi:hypothetical protein